MRFILILGLVCLQAACSNNKGGSGIYETNYSAATEKTGSNTHYILLIWKSAYEFERYEFDHDSNTNQISEVSSNCGYYLYTHFEIPEMRFEDIRYGIAEDGKFWADKNVSNAFGPLSGEIVEFPSVEKEKIEQLLLSATNVTNITRCTF
ncbi:MAG: hypothetical protein AAGB31_15480 [Bdellovibrio sp.]